MGFNCLICKTTDELKETLKTLDREGQIALDPSMPEPDRQKPDVPQIDDNDIYYYAATKKDGPKSLD